MSEQFNSADTVDSDRLRLSRKGASISVRDIPATDKRSLDIVKALMRRADELRGSERG